MTVFLWLNTERILFWIHQTLMTVKLKITPQYVEIVSTRINKFQDRNVLPLLVTNGSANNITASTPIYLKKIFFSQYTDRIRKAVTLLACGATDLLYRLAPPFNNNVSKRGRRVNLILAGVGNRGLQPSCGSCTLALSKVPTELSNDPLISSYRSNVLTGSQHSSQLQANKANLRQKH